MAMMVLHCNGNSVNCSTACHRCPCQLWRRQRMSTTDQTPMARWLSAWRGGCTWESEIIPTRCRHLCTLGVEERTG